MDHEGRRLLQRVQQAIEGLIGAVVALKPKLWLATAAYVVLAVGSAQAAPSFPSAPHVRGAIHIHEYRGGWGHHHGWGWGPWAWLGLGAGIVASAIIADEAYRPHPGHYYDEGPYDGPYYYPSNYGGDPREICAENFRSFEWETGFYTTYTGERRLCPYLADAQPPPAAAPPPPREAAPYYGAAPPPPGAAPYRDAGPLPPAAAPYRDPGLPRVRPPYDDAGPPPGAIDLRRLLDFINRRLTYLLHRDQTIGHAYLMRVKDFMSLNEACMN